MISELSCCNNGTNTHPSHPHPNNPTVYPLRYHDRITEPTILNQNDYFRILNFAEECCKMQFNRDVNFQVVKNHWN